MRMRERENYHLQVFFVHPTRSLEIANNTQFTILSQLDTGFRFKDPKLVQSKLFEMNPPKIYKAQVFMLDGGEVF